MRNYSGAGYSPGLLTRLDGDGEVRCIGRRRYSVLMLALCSFGPGYRILGDIPGPLIGDLHRAGDMRGQLAINLDQVSQQAPPVEVGRAAAQGDQLREDTTVQFPMRRIGSERQTIHQRFLFTEAGPRAVDKPLERLEQLLGGPFFKIHHQNFNLSVNQSATHRFDGLGFKVPRVFRKGR